MHSRLCLSSAKLSPELLKEIDKFNHCVPPTSPEEEEKRDAESIGIFSGEKRRVKIVLDRELYEGPGSITSEIGDLSEGCELHSIATTIVATISLVHVFQWSLVNAVQMISLMDEQAPVNNGVGC